VGLPVVLHIPILQAAIFCKLRNANDEREERVSEIVFTTFAQVQNALQTFITTNNIPTAQAPHGNIWERGSNEDEQYQNFVTGVAIAGYSILTKGDGANSNIILALRGQPPFDGSEFPQMPAPNGPYLDNPTIDAIAAWIDAGAKQ
jgi:hypothetical protein